MLSSSLMGWIDDADALVAGLEELNGEAVAIGDVELLHCAVFLNCRPRRLNCRPRRRVDDFGCGVSRLIERVKTCNENGRLNCVA